MYKASLALLSLVVSGSLAAQGGFPPANYDDGAPPVVNKGVTPQAGAVLPKAYASAFGSTANTFPQARANMRYQQVFLGSEIGRPLVVREVCLRLDERFGGPAQTQAIDLYLGSSKFNQNTITTNFASNYNGTLARKQVFSGNINLPAHSGGGTLTSWGICFKVTNFVWTNPTGENLIVEFINKSASSRSHFEDFCFNNTTRCTTTRVYAFNANATVATSRFVNQGLIMLISDGNRPKPGKYGTFGTGCKGSGLLSPCRVLPKGYDQKFGTSANTFPHARANMRYQQLFLGSELPRADRWTELCFRLDERFGGPAQSQSIEVYLGSSKQGLANVLATFASNYNGARPRTQVFNGTLNLPTHSGGGKLDSFSICFKFTTPYVWANGANENLMTEFINKSTTSRSHFEDWANTNENATTYRHYAFQAAATARQFGFRNGLIMCLKGTAGPGAIPALTNSGVPEIGKSFDVNLSKAKGTAPALLSVGIKSNINLGSGCTLYASLIALIGTATNAAGDAKVTLALPNDTNLKCVKFANQWIVIDNGGALFGVVALSNGGEGEIGG